MQNIFVEVTSLDKRCVETLALSEEVMMEHAANGIAQLIRSRFTPHSSILIVCGSGNNGADGLALARLLQREYHITVHLPFGASSSLAHLQRDRIESLGMKHSPIEGNYDIIVDALFGSGLNRPLGPSAVETIEQMNTMSGVKIACDIPSGLYSDGTFGDIVFDANITVTMGGLKRSLFSDAAKEITGEIIVADLGVPRRSYETESSWKLLETADLKLPLRTHSSTHKGSYGHLSVVCGEKIGASVIAASAALRFGTGLVSVVSNENLTIPHELMQSHSLPSGTTAIALGMGLGEEFCDDELSQLLDNTHPMILDADIFYHPIFPDLLKRNHIVLTPHPKEFTQILRLSGIADIDVNTLQNDRFGYVEKFCTAYPNTVLVLKGSNVIIGTKEAFYINPHGTVALAKGGSGDVLSGLIGALLAQGYSPLEAALQASLAHTIAARHFEKNNYALTPFDLIERICIL